MYVLVCMYVYVCVCVCEPVTCVADPGKLCFPVFCIYFLCLIISPLLFHTPINSPFSTASSLVGCLIQVQIFKYSFAWENEKQLGTLP